MLRFIIEARENVSKVLKDLDANVARYATRIEGNFEEIGDASEEAADATEEGSERVGKAVRGMAQTAYAATAKAVASFEKFGNNYAESLKNFSDDLAKVGVSTEKAAKMFTENIAGLTDPAPFDLISRRGTAMAQKLGAVLDATGDKAKKAAAVFLHDNTEAIKGTIAQYKKYGEAVPLELAKAEAAIDRINGKLQQGKIGRMADVITRLKGLSAGDTAAGAIAMGASHYMRGRAEETYGTARNAAQVSMGGKDLVKDRYREISNTRMATGANIQELAAINSEFAKMAHLGPQSFKEVGTAAMKLSRTTGMGVDEAAKFNLNLRQMYKMSGAAADEVSTKITVLSKLSGVSADEFAQIYDELKFTRFALDGNVESAKRLANTVAEAAAEMGKYGISSKDILKDVKGRMTGGIDEYTKNIKALVMGGKTVKEAQDLLDAEARGDKGATAEIAKAKGQAYARLKKMSGGGARGNAMANTMATTMGLGDVEELQKQAAYAKGEMKGPVEEFIKNPRSEEAKKQRAQATEDIATASELRQRGYESAAGATALSQQGIYELEIQASKLFMKAAQQLEGVTGRLGSAGTNLLGGAAQLGAMAYGGKVLWQGAKAVLNIGSKGAGVAGVAGEAAGAAGVAGEAAGAAGQAAGAAGQAGRVGGILARTRAGLTLGSERLLGGVAGRLPGWGSKAGGLVGRAGRFIANDLGTLARSGTGIARAGLTSGSERVVGGLASRLPGWGAKAGSLVGRAGALASQIPGWGGRAALAAKGVAGRVAAVGSKIPGLGAVGRVASKVALPAQVGYELGNATKKLLVAWVGKKEAEAEAYDSEAQAKYQKLQLYKKQVSKAEELGDAAKVKKLREQMSKEFGTRASGPAALAPVPETPMKMGETAKAAGMSAQDKAVANTVEAMATATEESTEKTTDSAKDVRDYMSQAAIYAARIASGLRGAGETRTSPSTGSTSPSTVVESEPGRAGSQSRAYEARQNPATAQVSSGGGEATGGGPTSLGQAIAKQEGYYAKGKAPNHGQRNNNPGNIRVYGWKKAMDPAEAMRRAKKQGAEGYDPKSGFLKFSSPEAGFKGLDRQLGIDAKRGLSVGQLIEKYAPPSENNTAAYKNAIAKSGFASNMPLSQAMGRTTAEPVTPPLGVMASQSMTPPQQMASMATPVQTAPEPFTGATKGDQSVVAEIRRGNAILAQLASATNRPGRNPNPASPMFNEIVGGGMG